MTTAYRGFQLGLLPARKINKRAMVTSYALVTLLLLIVINMALILLEKLQLRQYHVTDMIPMPSLRPEPAPIAAKPEIKVKPLSVAKLPVFEQPKLVVPHELRRQAEQPVEAPKVVVNQFAAPELKLANAVRPQLVHTGDFGGSSQKPTVNAAVDKVQTGGFGDPKGLPGTGRQGAKLYTASTGSLGMAPGARQGTRLGGATRIRGTVASADFGSGIATTSKGSSKGSGVATGGFGSEQVVHSTGPKIAQPDSA